MSERRDRLWSVQDVADFLGIPRKTLYQWRQQGYGPRGHRVGRYLRYDERAVREWFASLGDGAA
jgi:excisionase family DNA binding protein